MRSRNLALAGGPASYLKMATCVPVPEALEEYGHSPQAAGESSCLAVELHFEFFCCCCVLGGSGGLSK